jgi:Mn2+/Fe2+ NRAMP family transporter
LNDFGSQGEWPSHPELLDWLAVQFRDGGEVSKGKGRGTTGAHGVTRPTRAWDVKGLVRLMVTSATYRQSAAVNPEKLERDPYDRLFTRGPRVRLDAEFMALVVACIGTSLSAYIYTWQSNQEVEEQIAIGRRQLWQRKGASRREMKRTSRDVLTGMIFSNLILYFIILATGLTLHPAGQHRIETAAQAAAALEPLAGDAAKYLFAAGVVGVGFLAVPIMTTGAAYDIVQGLGRHGSLHDEPGDNRLFYGVIALVTALAVGLNFFGFNPMRALVWSGIVQGFSVPPLLFLMMLLTNSRRVVGARTNGRWTNFLGWATTAITFLCTATLVVSWF